MKYYLLTLLVFCFVNCRSIKPSTNPVILRLPFDTTYAINHYQLCVCPRDTFGYFFFDSIPFYLPVDTTWIFPKPVTLPEIDNGQWHYTPTFYDEFNYEDDNDLISKK